MGTDLKIENESDVIMSTALNSGKLSISEVDQFRAKMLSWYKAHQRTLPWRVNEGSEPNPYHVWLSEIMLQQTVVATVIPYFKKFVEKWPTVQDLAGADRDEIMEAWAGLGYYSRARNLHKCAQQIVENHAGKFPVEQGALKELPGIGDYTSAAIRSITFNLPATVIDGNVERVLSRYFAIKTPLPEGKKDIRIYAAALSEHRADHPSDYAQSLMDLGALICSAKSPKCGLCPVSKSCKAHALGKEDLFPIKAKKKQRPHKYGYVFWVRNHKGQLLIQRRPDQGLLAGMLGLPTTNWEKDKDLIILPKWCSKTPQDQLKVTHIFTHFSLDLFGQVIDIKEKDIDLEAGYHWIDKNELKPEAFPSVFKKFVNLMLHNSIGDEIKTH